MALGRGQFEEGVVVLSVISTLKNNTGGRAGREESRQGKGKDAQTPTWHMVMELNWPLTLSPGSPIWPVGPVVPGGPGRP